ncbi:collagen-like protein [Fodinibius saliphilus]|uniref:collagen-like protein n=1 Tax=Fodinibius saliphilus TaxID=1920650 RepID=UPI001107B8BC|nr:collagen-like protein [Fodinibius saliphilus]
MMRKITVTVLLLFVISCGGEEGPVGPEGPPGPSGKIYEIETSFTESNNYTVFSTFPDDITVLESDIVMVYLLWEVDQETGNDVWQPLPVSVFFDNGEMQYAFDHTFTDAKLFLTGDVDLSTVGDEFTRNQIFRIAILPADYIQSNKVDMSNMEEVVNAIGSSNVKHLQLQDY